MEPENEDEVVSECYNLAMVISLLILLFSTSGSFAAAPPLRTFQEVLDFIRDEKITGMDPFGQKIAPLMKSGFTIAHSSGSNQGPERVLYFGKDAKLTIGIGLKDDFVEITEGTKTHLIPHRISWEGGVLKEVKPHVALQDCRICHGDPMAPIYPQYDQWPNMVGGSDDVPGPHYEATVGKLLAAPRFSTLFPKDFNPSTGHYPYQAPGERKIENMPNFVFTLKMSRQAAYRLVERMKLSAGYERYRHLLAASILGCPFAGTYNAQIKAETEQSFPSPFKEEGDSPLINLMRLMNGDPLGLILPRPLNEVEPSEYPNLRIEIMRFNTGGGYGEFQALILGGLYRHLVEEEKDARKLNRDRKAVWEPHFKSYKIAELGGTSMPYDALAEHFAPLDELIVGFGAAPDSAPNKFTQEACVPLEKAVKDALLKHPFQKPVSRKIDVRGDTHGK